ncbi:hypothetical protein HDU89_003343 [Geranomyces variabilis]|nr:hypothetical protein HDU89_003343 [Geranomyces variabilis]
MSVNGPPSSGSNVRRRFSGSLMPRNNGNTSPVDDLAGFDSVLHSEDPLLNPSYKLNSNMAHLHGNHHFEHHGASHLARLNMQGHNQPLSQHPHSLHPHHPHLPYNLHQQHQDNLFDHHQFLRDGTPSESSLARHHQQGQDQLELHQPTRSQRAVSASAARPGSTHSSIQNGHMQDLPPFSAAESVLRFLATTDSGEMFSLPPPNSQQQEHYDVQQQHYIDDLNLGNATSARYQHQNISESDESDDAFLKGFSELGISGHDDHEYFSGHDMQNGGFSGMYPNQPGDYSLPETTNSVIRPFLFDAFLGTNAELGLSADDYRYGSTFDHGFPHQPHLHQQLHHQQSVGSFESHSGLSLTPRHVTGLSREYDDVDFGNMFAPPGKPYSAVPPPGYICKLWYACAAGHFNICCVVRLTNLPFSPPASSKVTGLKTAIYTKPVAALPIICSFTPLAQENMTVVSHNIITSTTATASSSGYPRAAMETSLKGFISTAGLGASAHSGVRKRLRFRPTAMSAGSAIHRVIGEILIHPEHAYCGGLISFLIAGYSSALCPSSQFPRTVTRAKSVS